MIVFAAAGPRVYNEHDLVFAEELARRASTAMHNAELFQTAKKERERAEEAATLRERLVAIVGHDLRNPLSSISMAAQMLSSSALATAEEELVSRIQRSANRMTRMIDQILDFARIRSGQSFELQLESADLRQVCQSVIDELRLSRPDQEIALSIEGRADAVFDSDRIAQVLSNLIGNAIQHGTGGPISVTVREATPDAVAIEVHNFGPAIPKAAQAGLFDAFNRETTAGDTARASGWACSSPTRSCARTEARSPCGHPIETGPRSVSSFLEDLPSAGAQWSPHHRSFIDPRCPCRRARCVLVIRALLRSRNCSEAAEQQPVRKRLDELARTGKLDRTVPHGRGQRRIAQPDLRESAQVRLDAKIHFVPRIREAELDLWALEHEPVVVWAAALAGYAAEREENHHAVFRQSIESEPMMQVPHQKVGIEVVRVDTH